jgi:Na+/H+-dicarboxylate symporter
MSDTQTERTGSAEDDGKDSAKRHPLGFWFRIPLWQRILGALVLGVIVGLILGPQAEALKPVGDLFIRLLRMLVAPLILATLVSGVASLDDASTMGRLGLKALGLYLFTTAFAITIGLLAANIFQPGNVAEYDESAAGEAPEQGSFSLTDTLLELVPTNPFAALAEGEVLQIIVFALFVGIAIVAVGERAAPVKRFFDAFAEIMYKITSYVMEVAPLGVFALIAWVVGTNDASVLLNLSVLVLTAYVAMITHALFVYGGLIKFAAGLPLVRFFRGIADAQAVAYSTATSSGTLPVTLRCVQDNLGVSKSTAGFVLPLGATINMDGTALYQGVIAVFAAQLFGIDLSLIDYATIVLTATLVSIGTAGIPGVSILLATITLSSVGLPLEVLPFILAVDRLVDMARTATNVTGDATVSTLIAKSENALDEDVFRARPDH